jgi:uncharacterized protein (DUF1501 family)
MLNLRMASTAAAYAAQPNEDYKALVCLFLAGGNDSFNMLVPMSSAEYSDYSNIRTDLAIPFDSLLPLNTSNSAGQEFGVHPSMPEVQQMFDSGELAFLSNVGTLVEPTTLQQFESGSVKLPLGLFSHSDQIQHWQTSVPDQRNAVGWGGRTADLIASLNDSQNISMNISLSGSNIFQTGKTTVEYTLDPYEGSVGIEGYGNPDPEDFWSQLKTTAIDSMLDIEYRNLFEQTFANVTRNAIDSNNLFSSALSGVGDFQTQFADNEVSKSFQMVARTIAARQQLGMKRQTFFIMFGGWDHHDELINNQAMMLSIISKSLSEFNGALKELGLENQVTTFTSSDFARTLSSNGKGSDHAWGSNQMVMGGAVNGQNVFGTYPRLFEGNELDTGRGVLVPTMSVDEYFSELALWFGVSPSELDTVFPNIDRFYEVGSSSAPVGFMRS